MTSRIAAVSSSPKDAEICGQSRCHVETARFEHQRDDGKACDEVAARIRCRLPEAVMRRQIAVIGPKRAQPVAQQGEMARLVIGDLHPVVEETQRNLHRRETRDDVEREVDGVQFDMGESMHQCDAPGYRVQRTLLQQARCDQLRLFRPAGAIGRGRIGRSTQRQEPLAPLRMRVARNCDLLVQIRRRESLDAAARSVSGMFRSPAGGSAERPDGLENVLGVTGHFHLAPDPGDLAVPADQEGRTFNAHIFPAIHALFGPDAVILQGALFLIGDKRRPKGRALP
jgi:hypothetical protein